MADLTIQASFCGDCVLVYSWVFIKFERAWMEVLPLQCRHKDRLREEPLQELPALNEELSLCSSHERRAASLYWDPCRALVEVLMEALLPYVRVDKGEKVEHSLALRNPFRLGYGYPVQTRIILLQMGRPEGELFARYTVTTNTGPNHGDAERADVHSRQEWSIMVGVCTRGYANTFYHSRHVCAQALAELAMANSGVVSMTLLICFFLLAASSTVNGHSLEVEYNPDRPLSRMLLHRQLTAMNSAVNISATPQLLGSKGESSEWVTVTFSKTKGAAIGDFIALFCPAKFDGKDCATNDTKTNPPQLCSAPIKFEYANFTSPKYVQTGYGTIKTQILNMRTDCAFGFFSGDVDKPVLEGISNVIKFEYSKAPLWPRLALGKQWNEMTITWTSGYSESEARPIVAWKWEDDKDWKTSLASTVTYKKSDMCGPPANSVGWRDPGYIHTAYLKELGPSAKYMYKVGHKLKDGKFWWGEDNYFKSAPNVGEDSLQRVIVYGDMGKRNRDNWMEYNNGQPSALTVTDALIKDVDNYDIIFSNGDITYADGYLSEWDQFVDQLSPFIKRVPYMLSIGNHERDYPGTGSYYTGHDSGGECGVVTPTVFQMPGENNDKLWYAANWGSFKFCVGNSEIDWTIGSEQHMFLEHCFASTDRSKQPWLIFLMHRVVGYSSAADYQEVWGTFGEPNGRSNLEDLWQKYKVDLAFYGHVHSYERSFPVYQSVAVSDELSNYSGRFNGTIHIVAGTAGHKLEQFGPVNTTWSAVKNQDVYGFVKMTSKNPQNLLVEFLNAKDLSVVDSFSIAREFQDVLGCDNSIQPICPKVSTVDYS